MEEMQNKGWEIFGGRLEGADSSMMAPVSPEVIVDSFQDLVSVSDFSVSAMGEDRWFELCEDLEVPFATEPEAAIKRIACFNTCSRKSFLMYSFTRTISGAYGDVPPNAKRAVTRCSAADARSAVRSTIAMTLRFGETS